jgi:hypothetical protein
MQDMSGYILFAVVVGAFVLGYFLVSLLFKKLKGPKIDEMTKIPDNPDVQFKNKDWRKG